MKAASRYAALALLVGLLTGPGLATSSAASCAADSGPSDPDVIFIGTMLEERRGYSRLRVKEVWAGPELAEEVWVMSGQEQAAWPLYFVVTVSGSLDAELEVGQEHIIITSENFDIGGCQGDEITMMREPSDRRSPTADGLTGADPPHPTWVGVLGLFAFPAALIAGLRYRKQTRRRRQSADASQPGD